ncbi:MAG: hypothetical protein NC082_08020 [Clostridiales bacterium]|nr:hypothetical protein [Clostridiales bacterium]
MFSWLKRHSKAQARLPFSTDVHCHVVPGIDDGSPSVDYSLTLLRHMEKWGIERVIPTPHVTEDTYENTPATIDPAYGALVAGAREAGIGIELLTPSAEYRIDSFFLSCLEKGLVRPLSNNYLLVENNFMNEPIDLDEVLFGLSAKGFTPVLAHPERYIYYTGNHNRYKELHNNGVLFQCNLMSFGGYYGKEIMNTAHWLLKNDLVDFIGTDLHRRRHIEFIEQYLTGSNFRNVAGALEGRLYNDQIISTP